MKELNALYPTPLPTQESFLSMCSENSVRLCAGWQSVYLWCCQVKAYRSEWKEESGSQLDLCIVKGQEVWQVAK